MRRQDTGLAGQHQTAPFLQAYVEALTSFIL
jgi:hypothetical protein